MTSIVPPRAIALRQGARFSLQGLLVSRAFGPVTAALAAVIITSWELSRTSITLVETATFTAASRPLSTLPSLLGGTDAVLAPYYLAMHFWLLLSHSLWWMRLPGVLASAATAALLVVIGRRRSLAVGIAAGLLFAVMAAASRYAEDARPYAFAMLVATFATWRLLIAVEKPHLRAWIWYGVAVVALGLVHVFALLLLPAHGGYAARRHWRPWLSAVAVAVAVLSPLLYFGSTQVNSELSWADRPGLHSLRALAGEISGNAALTVVFAALAAIGIARLWRGDRQWAWLLGGWLVIPPLVLFAAAQLHPVYATRYLAFIAPALCLLVAIGTTSLPRPAALLAGAVIVVLLVPVQLGLRRPVGHDGNNLSLMTRELDSVTRPGDGIVYEPSTVRRVFAGFARPPAGTDVLLLATPDASNTLTGTNVAPAVLAKRLAALARVWVVRVTDRNINTSPLYRDATVDLRGSRPVQRIQMPGGSITLYVKPS